MGRHVILVAIWALLVPMLGAAPARAQGALRVCAVEWPPYLAFTGGEARGPVADRVRDAAKAMGAVASIVEMTIPRCAHEIEAGRQDALFPFAGEAGLQLIRSAPVVEAKLGYYVHAASPIRKVPDSLAGLTAVTALGVTLSPEILRGARQMPMANIKDAIALMAAGHADLAFGDLVTIAKSYPDARPLDPPLMRRLIGLGFSARDDRLRQAFDRVTPAGLINDR